MERRSRRSRHRYQRKCPPFLSHLRRRAPRSVARCRRSGRALWSGWS